MPLTNPHTDTDYSSKRLPLKRNQVTSLLKKWLSRKPAPIFLLEQPKTVEDEERVSNPLCYIARLPVELLCEVFARCVPLGIYGEQYPTPRVEDAPMLLCHVSSHWRRVALSFTALWSSFSVRRFAFYRNRNLDRNALFAAMQGMVQLWLERSRPHPISVEFGCHTLISVRQLMFANAHRWESLFITLDDSVVEQLMEIPQEGTSLVESLSLFASHCKTTIRSVPELLLRFPNLRRLLYYDFDTPETLFPSIPWSQLTHITLHCELPRDQFLKSLGQCILAEYIDVETILPSAPIQCTPVTLPKLAYLRLESKIDHEAVILLDGFTLPSLRTLKFNTWSLTSSRCELARRSELARQGELAYAGLRALEALASRSSCTLETLHVDGWTLLEEELIRYLSLPCLQSLRELEISSFKVFDPTISFLAYPSTPSGVGGILPYLEILHLRDIYATDGQLANMILSRWKPTKGPHSPASLKKVKLYMPPDDEHPHYYDTLCINKLAEQGLSVSWSWYG